ncbi:hypothetical protein V497_07533 [Pseudogymnoascus sp. VKM F-4516 (FW-969)]|nr:hypothetical protein V497_07533 [Pseudogymnoascus sp. VKM F-4516 (FW-969)]
MASPNLRVPALCYAQYCVGPIFSSTPYKVPETVQTGRNATANLRLLVVQLDAAPWPTVFFLRTALYSTRLKLTPNCGMLGASLLHTLAPPVPRAGVGPALSATCQPPPMPHTPRDLGGDEDATGAAQPKNSPLSLLPTPAMARRAAIAAVLASAASLVAAASSKATEPCAVVSNLFQNGEAIPAATGFACLSSVPFDAATGIATVENFQKLSQFHSTLGDIKNPGVGYANKPVDIIGMLDKVITMIKDGKFKNQYQFEEQIALITGLSFDGHYTFLGNTFYSSLDWYRGGASDGAYEGSLISVSLDGKELPQVYFTTDLTNEDASPIVQIDGEDVVTYLTRESQHQLFHDADARWNVLFARQQSDSVGSFVMPWFYPGSNFTATMANGDTKTVLNYAAIPQALEEQWSQVTDGKSFYSTFVSPQTATTTSTTETPETPATPERSLRKRYVEKRLVPPNYPRPVIQHAEKEVELGAFFLGPASLSEVAVLSMNTFDPVASGDSVEFQALIQKFLKYAKSKGRNKIVIDVSSNGGGSLFLGYDTFKQFFPSKEPDIGARMRYSTALDIIGTAFGTITIEDAANGSFDNNGLTPADMYLSPIHYTNSVDADQEDFSSWADLKGPVTINGASYTQVLRYNFSDPYLYQGDTIESVTGYGPLADTPKQPYAAEDIILLHDGYCASTCAVFSDLMRRLGGVRSVVLGGRPQFGPMQAVGGTKGVLVEPWEAIEASVTATLADFGTAAQKKKWAGYLPEAWPIAMSNPPTVNFRSGYHPGSDTPMQFLNESANCRMFYTPAMLTNVTNIWETVARLAWNIGGGTGQSCVQGSYSDGEPIGETKSVGKKVATPDAVVGGTGNQHTDEDLGLTVAGSGDGDKAKDGGSKEGAAGVARVVSWGVLGGMALLSGVVLQI